VGRGSRTRRGTSRGARSGTSRGGGSAAAGLGGATAPLPERVDISRADQTDQQRGGNARQLHYGFLLGDHWG
jgi:hypothetical protein